MSDDVKPAFDPNQSFDKIDASVSQKPAFDPSQSFDKVDPSFNKQEQVAKNQQDLLDTARTFATGAGNGLTLGLVPQIVGGVSKYIAEPIINSLTNQDVYAQDTDGNPVKMNVQGNSDKTYAQYRDAQNQQQQQDSQAHPIANFAGQIAGGAPLIAGGFGVGGLNSVLGAAEGAGLGARMLGAAKIGGALGIASNPGETHGEVSPLQPIERLKNAGVGSILGPTTELIGTGIGKLGNMASSASQDLGEYANTNFVKAVGGMKGNTKDIPDLQKFGKAIGSEGITNPDGTITPLVEAGDSIHDIAEKASAFKDEVGKKIGSIYENADALGSISKKDNSIDIEKIAKDALKDARTRYFGKAGGTDVIAALEKDVNDIAVNGKVGFKDAQEIRQSVDESVPWGSNSKMEASIAKERKILRTNIQDEIKSKLSDLDNEHGTDMLDQFKTENARYGNAVKAENLSQAKMRGVDFNRAWGLGEQTAAIAGAGVAGGPGAIAAPIIEKIAKERGIPIAARVAQGASELLARPEISPIAQSAGAPIQALGRGIQQTAPLIGNFRNKK